MVDRAADVALLDQSRKGDAADMLGRSFEVNIESLSDPFNREIWFVSQKCQNLYSAMVGKALNDAFYFPIALPGRVHAGKLTQLMKNAKSFQHS